MSTKHKAAHLKAALLVASKDTDRPNICQVSVSGARIEATNGHMMLRIDREAPGDEEDYAGCVPRAALQNVLRAQGVHDVLFRAENEDRDEHLVAQDEDDNELVRADVGIPHGGFPDLDAILAQRSTTASRDWRIRISPDLFIAALRAVKASGCAGAGATLIIPEKAEDPVTITAEDGEGVIITVLAMPLRSDEVAS